MRKAAALEGVFAVTHLDWLIVETNTQGFFLEAALIFPHRLSEGRQSTVSQHIPQCRLGQNSTPTFITQSHGIYIENRVTSNGSNNRKKLKINITRIIVQVTTTGADERTNCLT